VGMRALPEEMMVPPPRPPAPLSLAEIVELLPRLREAAAADSMDPEAWFRLGTAHFSIGQFDAAVEQLRQAIDLDSSRVVSWIALGRASYFAGFPALSARAYWNVIRLDPAALDPTGFDRVILDAALSSELEVDVVEP